MSYTEVTEQGCLGRLMSSITGIFFGFILLLVSIVVLFWNEGRAVHMAQSLAEGKGNTVSVGSDKVDPAQQGKLVHVSGDAHTSEALHDEEFGVTAEGALKLRRVVEMYQWKEKKDTQTHKKLGGGTETVTQYTYEQVWSEQLLDSSAYKEPGHTNPATMRFHPNQMLAQKVALGAFELPPDLLDKLSNYTQVDAAPSPKHPKLQADQGKLCSGDPSSPKVGDIRITFQQVQGGPYSLIGVQSGSSFGPYTAKAGGNTIYMIEPGNLSAAQMYKSAEDANTTLTWILRLVGVVLMFVSFCMFFGPLQVLADIIPFLGDIFGLGVALFSFVATLVVSMITIAIGWIVFRPVMGILLLAAAGAVLYFGVKAGKGRR